MNSHEPRIKFTMEHEKNNQMAFLDLSIKRVGRSFVTKVCRKDTHTFRYINWRSNHPKKLLLGVLKGLIDRAHKLCDLEEDLQEELDLLRDIFISNDYPVRRIDEVFQDYIPKCKGGGLDVYDQMEKDNRYIGRDIITVPYIPGIFERLQYDLAREGTEVSLLPKSGETVKSMICSIQAKDKIEETSDVIYRINCKTCGKGYIGETAQKFYKRRGQHKGKVRGKDEENGIYMHLKKNRRHKIDWEACDFLDRESKYYGRKIKEALYINAFDPNDDLEELMNIEKGANVNQCWREFNEQVKGTVNV